MKKFLEGVLEWKTYACMMFTGVMMVFWVISFALGREGISLGILLDLFLLSIIGSLVQAVAFSQWIFKHLRYPLRFLLFAVIYLPILALFAVFRGWFPTSALMNWLIFVAIFFGIFIVMTVGFEIYFHMVGKKYDGLLGEKQRNKIK